MTDTLERVLTLVEPGEECAPISWAFASGTATRLTSFPPASEDVPWTAVVLVAPCCRSPLARQGVLEAIRRRMGDRTVLVTRFCPDNALGLPELPPVRSGEGPVEGRGPAPSSRGAGGPGSPWARPGSPGGAALSLNRACYRLGVDPRRVQRAACRRAGRALGALDTPLLLSAVRRWLDVR